MAGCTTNTPMTLTSDHYSSTLFKLHANGNTAETINTEIHATPFLNLLQARFGKSIPLKGFSCTVTEFGYSTELTCESQSEVERFVERYINLRSMGHTQTYAMARLQAEPDPMTLTPDGKTIINKDQEAFMPWLWLYSFINNGNTNYTTYMILDGEIAWTYLITRKNDRSLLFCDVDLIDSQEVLPQHRAAFEEVEKQVEGEMRTDGTWGTFGSCHRLWDRKKELLNQRGIDWRTPKNLHPGTLYD